MLVVPLSLPKELTSLRYFCLLSFAFVLYLCGVVVGESFHYNPPFADNLNSLTLFTFSGIATTFPTGVFAYMSHPNVLDVYRVSPSNKSLLIGTPIQFYEKNQEGHPKNHSLGFRNLYIGRWVWIHWLCS